MKGIILLMMLTLISCGEGGKSNSEIVTGSDNQTASFAPSDLSGLALWLDSADSTTIFKDVACSVAATTEGDSVGCWEDKSGLGHHATMTDASQMPSLKTGVHPSKSLIEFDGNNDFFDNSYNYSARTAFIVFRSDTTLQKASELGQLWGNYGEAHIAADPRSGTFERGFSFDGATVKTAEYALDGENFVGFVENSNSAQWAQNSFNLISVNFQNTNLFSRQVIGSLYPHFSVGAHQFGGQIAEMVIFDDLLSLSDRVKVEGYLACKWGVQGSLAAGHAYRTDCP